MQPTHYSTCLYGHEGWATPARHAQSLHDYVDIDFRFKRSRNECGNSYVSSRGVDAAAMLDVDLPQRTYQRTTDAVSAHAQSYDDVISGVYSEAVIARRNERERNRVKTINQTFARLRQHLPSSAAASVIRPATHGAGTTHGAVSAVTKAKKLSKVQILRAAIHYIGQLQQLLTTSDDDTDSLSDAEDNKLSRQTQRHYSSSGSSVNSASVPAGLEHRRHQQTDYSSSTHIKRKTTLCLGVKI